MKKNKSIIINDNNIKVYNTREELYKNFLRLDNEKSSHLKFNIINCSNK